MTKKMVDCCGNCEFYKELGAYRHCLCVPSPNCTKATNLDDYCAFFKERKVNNDESSNDVGRNEK